MRRNQRKSGEELVHEDRGKKEFEVKRATGHFRKKKGFDLGWCQIKQSQKAPIGWVVGLGDSRKRGEGGLMRVGKVQNCQEFSGNAKPVKRLSRRTLPKEK